MKRKLNKKGFTLVELLAVIVVLALIMIIAGYSIGNVIQNSRANSFITSYKMVVKQIKLSMETGENDIVCGPKSPQTACNKIYDLKNDYSMAVFDSESEYTIYFGAAGVVYYDYGLYNTGTPTAGKKFSDLDLVKYGEAKNTDTNATECNKDAISDFNVTYCRKNLIIGKISK